jgi:hypothetical protein
MRKTVLTTIAGAALIAGSGLAAAQQRIESSPGGANGAQGSSQREPGGAAHERQPGAIQGPAQGRSTANGEQGRRSGESSEMQGPAQERSGGVEEKEHRSGQSGAVQGPAQERSGRSVGSPTLSSDQTTRLHEIIAGGNLQRVNHADFALSVGNPRAQYRDALRCSRNDCGHPPPISRLRVRCRQGRAGDRRSGDAGGRGGSSGLINLCFSGWLTKLLPFEIP